MNYGTLHSINHIFHHRFLVNTSGSGKTRLLFEGLCQHWGIYFTSSVDWSNLGRKDLATLYSSRFEDLAGVASLPSREAPHFLTALERHRMSVRRAFGEVLLARLLVFKLYAAIMCEEGPTDAHKRRWLLLQLRASASNKQDLFGRIADYLTDVTDTYLDDTIHSTLTQIHTIISSALFIAFDESSAAVHQFPGHFQDDGGHYPIFKEILRSCKYWTTDIQATIVAAGTEIPTHFFAYEPGEWVTARWVSNTGSFDNEKLYQLYVSQFLPPSFWQSESGKCLLQRMWLWLRGR